ncbi:MAG: hypothetical protein A2V46_15705 [Bacteroidetes bacterium RBG_19FT_COMBO_42_7]|nr:MAG: hypothetical protein A2V46_15705 [Bacteroidetes bacterium RBG_19FT_COMBO_42_7]
MNKTSVHDCSVLELPQQPSRVGNICIVESTIDLPFEIKRVFYIYNIHSGEIRGVHAHKECQELIIAASGTFEIEMNDGLLTRKVILNRPGTGLLIPAGIWVTVHEFSSDAICLVLTSKEYREEDYIREYNDFMDFKKSSLQFNQ